jgi:diacylglycerol kinase (ATP)
MILVIIMGFVFNISITEWCICITLFGLVISLELINTAIETVVDMITLDKNEKAKKAKDISASAVLVSAMASVVIGLIIFIPKILIIMK